MEEGTRKIIAVLKWILLTLWMFLLAMMLYLMYEFKHPVICTYKYVAVDGTSGNAKQCGASIYGSDYCRLNVKEVIAVQSYKEVCERK